MLYPVFIPGGGTKLPGGLEYPPLFLGIKGGRVCESSPRKSFYLYFLKTCFFMHSGSVLCIYINLWGAAPVHSPTTWMYYYYLLIVETISKQFFLSQLGLIALMPRFLQLPDLSYGAMWIFDSLNLKQVTHNYSSTDCLFGSFL